MSKISTKELRDESVEKLSVLIKTKLDKRLGSYMNLNVPYNQIKSINLFFRKRYEVFLMIDH